MMFETMEAVNVTRSGFLAPPELPPGSAEKVALISGEGAIWTYRDVQSVFETTASLRLSGRIGVLITNRLLSGLVSCAVMRQATCVPLDPALTGPEIEARISQLDLKTIITDESHRPGLTSPSLIMVKCDHLTISYRGQPHPADPSPEALILMTSGSTGRPKVVALSHRNLLHSVTAIIQSLDLKPEDRAVNLLPMSHIGGLVDLFLVPLISGGSVVFGDAHSPQSILSLLASAKPTWLQTAPAILQGLINATQGPSVSHSLRLIRSVSAPLSPALARKADHCFKVPLIEMYGMSETGGVITSNPLPPEVRKIGSVGKAVNCEIELRDDGGIWVRSAGLFAGYDLENDNEGLWDGDFFFTGDLGHLDDDGDLFLTGRAKDLINRGGQKIAPAEIDRLVESWDEIAEAASFSFPHPTLGEEVGLAFVLRDTMNLDDREIRHRLSSCLADYKCPKRLVRLEKLPRNQSGKLQRFRLAKIAPKEASATHPLSETGRRLLPIWQSALLSSEDDPTLDFFDQGGDSLSATTLLTAVEKEFKVPLDGFIFYENASIDALAKAIEERLSRHKSVRKRDPDFPPRIRKRLHRFLSSWPGTPPFEGSYARIDREGSLENPFLFWCCNGVKELDVIAKNIRSYLTLVSFRSLRLVQHKKLRNRALITAVYLDEVERLQPTGPVRLGGFCEGGRIMVEVGRALIEKGRVVQMLVLQDHNLEEPFPARIALIHSKLWKRHPVKLHHDIHRGWQKIYGGRYGVMEKDSGHSQPFSEKSEAILREFLTAQYEKSQGEEPSPIIRQDPDCSVRLISKIPRILKVGQPIRVRVLLKNNGPKTLVSGDGLALHARWVDLNKDPKPGHAMHTPLPSPLAPGETIELELEIIPHKRRRLYQLQIAFLEEGWGWPASPAKNSHRHWHLIC